MIKVKIKVNSLLFYEILLIYSKIKHDDFINIDLIKQILFQSSALQLSPSLLNYIISVHIL